MDGVILGMMSGDGLSKGLKSLYREIIFLVRVLPKCLLHHLRDWKRRLPQAQPVNMFALTD
jgi:hypothetical protein